MRLSRIRRSFSTFCRNRRLDLKLTEQGVEKFSERYGKDFYLSHSTISRIENQGLWPSLPKLLTLSRYYDLPVSAFYRAIGAKDFELHEVTRMEGLTKELQELSEDLGVSSEAREVLSYVLTAPPEAVDFIHQAYRAAQRIYPKGKKHRSVSNLLKRLFS